MYSGSLANFHSGRKDGQSIRFAMRYLNLAISRPAAGMALLSFCISLTLGQPADRRLDPTTFVVLGEGLAAGAANFTLSEEVQTDNFAVQVARQMDTIFPQPVFQSPGLGNPVGFPELPVRVPQSLQTTLRKQFPPSLFVFNLSVPGFHVEDAIQMRPVSPLIQQRDAKQTLVNFILGFPSLILGEDIPLWSQLEYAVAMRPTLAIVELGYHEVLAAAVKGDLSLLPNPAEFSGHYDQIVATLRGQHAQVVVMTIPDPFDTAYFEDPVSAAPLLRVPPFVLLGLYNLGLEDQLTVPGLAEIGKQFVSRDIGALPSGSFLPASVAAEFRFHVESLNQEIRAAAQRHDAVVYDLHALFKRVHNEGIPVAGRTLNSRYLGGFYGLDGYYPGITGHGLIANELLNLLNQTYDRSFASVAVAEIAARDPVFDYKADIRSTFSLEDLENFLTAEMMSHLRKLHERWEIPEAGASGAKRLPVDREGLASKPPAAMIERKRN